MHFTRRYLMAGFLAMLMLVPTAAGPLRPGQKELSNEVRSLGGLDTFKVAINVESRLLEDTNFPIDALKAKIEAMLTAAGFKLSDEPATPLVHVTLVTQGNEDHPALVSLSYHITVRQNVVIPRLEQTVFVPTYTLVHPALLEKENLRPQFDRDIKNLTTFLINRVRFATESL